MADTWAEGSTPKDGLTLECGMAPRVVKRVRLISRRPKYHKRRKLRLIDGASFNLEEHAGGTTVAVT